MYIRSDKTTWQSKRIKAMNRVIEKYNSSTEMFIEEYNRVCVSKAENKKQYKGEKNVGKLASPMLENWKISNQVNALKDEMERQGIPLDKIDSIVINAKANARKQGDGILSIGSMVHKFCELWVKGQPFTEPSDPVVKGCFDKFKRFWTKHKLKLIESEKILYSERGFCGTVDLIAEDSQKNLWLIDIKTSKGIFVNMVHQLHAYKLAYEEQTGKKIHKMYVVYNKLKKGNKNVSK
jgi:hypothetical protein